jgi:integrase
MSKKQCSRVEKNIYVENRCGAFRFKVVVHPLNDSATFSAMAEGVTWARRRRVELLEEKAGLAKPIVTPGATYQVLGVGAPAAANDPLESIKLSDVFDWFESSELSRLAGKGSEASRLVLLRKCFGECTLGQLDEDFIDEWKLDRFRGKYGSGRPPNRAAALGIGENGTPLTKHQRYALRKKGKDVPSQVHPVSSQSVRHELGLLRRAITKYFKKDKRRWSSLGACWQAHYLMQMELPEAAEPRSRRVSDDELGDIFSHINEPEVKAAILFAVLTSLRRSEILSLRWEDVDFKRKVVRLRKVGFSTKNKVNTRDVPLLPGALRILEDLKPQKFGPIFTITPGSFSGAWRQSADRANIFDARLHDCRRESLSRLVGQCGLSVPEAALFSGHRDLRTLQKHYLRLDPGAMASRLAELPSAINLALSL